MTPTEHRNTSLFSMVCIFSDQKEEPEREYLVNYSSQVVKEWLTRLTVWALCNNMTLSMERATNDDINSRRLFEPKGQEVEI